mmetsp:Transcript_27780/g.55974  ORF Transcript_27780/g.55974 Transcript_27780/m.55974 type:complete len:510 (+) Transcript_27780:44-1573(+)
MMFPSLRKFGSPPLMRRFTASPRVPGDPWLQNVVNTLTPLGCGFRMNAQQAQISPLFRPHEFYDTLIEAVERSRTRISLAALYLGTGELERRLVSSLANVLRTQPNLRVQLCFDGRRAWRQNKEGVSTISLISPLLEKYGDRISLSLFTLPAAQRAAVLPSPLDEVAGVFHMKAFCCDNEVIISGANLSTEYFVDRQDRYVYFGNAGSLAAYYHRLIETLGSCGETILPGAQGSSSKTPTQAQIASWRDRILLCAQNSADEELQSQGSEHPVVDTWVFPTLQVGPLGISQDYRATEAILKVAPQSGSVNLATAYLNPPPEFTALLAAASPAGVLRVLTAHYDSHGFHNARGLMSLVPKCYEAIARLRVLPALAAQRPGTSRFLSYRRQYWTYHAKGLWIWPTTDEEEGGGGGSEGKGSSASIVTVAGSSNYGRRSFELDLESQLVIASEDVGLRKSLEEEWNQLRCRCVVSVPQSSGGMSNESNEAVREDQRPTNFLASILSSLFGKHL